MTTLNAQDKMVLMRLLHIEVKHWRHTAENDIDARRIARRKVDELEALYRKVSELEVRS